MSRAELVASVALLLPALSIAEDGMHGHDHRTMEIAAPAGAGAAINVTINPEARVSATVAGTFPPASCKSPASLVVNILNDGFITSQLEAEVIGDMPAGIKVDFHPEPLQGVVHESRTVQITQAEPGLTDLTIAFRLHNGAADLGGRNLIHLLVNCVPRGT